MKKIPRYLCVLVSTSALATSSLRGDEQGDKIQALEKRIEQLEKLLQARDAKPASPGETPRQVETPKPGASLSVGSSGFVMRSADTNFTLRLRGLLDVDSRWYVNDGGISDTDGFFVRRARPIIEGTLFRDFEFRFTPEFGGSSTVIRDAWMNYHYNDAFQINIGKMKPPGGLERWQGAANLPFVERSLVSGLWPVRDLGVMLHGELWSGAEADTKRLAAEGVVHYAFGAFNGAADDRAAGNADTDGNTELAARLFFHPFLKSGPRPLRGLGLGVAGTYGQAEGSGGLPSGGAYGTEGQQDMFAYLSGDGTAPGSANVTADGNHWRLGPQAYWFHGPLGVQAEYGISSQELRRDDGTTSRLRANHQAWSVTGSWLLTGEDASFKAVTPKRNFTPQGGGLGALQLVARYSVFDFDNDVFPNFADPTESATRANAWGVGLNWYLNRNARLMLNYLHTDFTGGASGSVTRQNENVILTRAQVVF